MYYKKKKKKKKILDVIHRRGCLQIVVAALHAIIQNPTDLPKFSVVVDNNLIPPNLFLVVDVTQSNNLMEDDESFFGAALGFF